MFSSWSGSCWSLPFNQRSRGKGEDQEARKTCASTVVYCVCVYVCVGVGVGVCVRVGVSHACSCDCCCFYRCFLCRLLARAPPFQNRLISRSQRRKMLLSNASSRFVSPLPMQRSCTCLYQIVLCVHGLAPACCSLCVRVFMSACLCPHLCVRVHVHCPSVGDARG